MTIEKAQRDFGQEITKNGFTEAARTTDTNIIVYHRVWSNDSKTLEIRIILSGTYTLASIKINGKEDPKFIRDYSSPKRAISAIQSTVRRAGYEW